MVQPPETKSVVNGKSILEMCFSIFFFFLIIKCRLFELGFAFFAIILSVLCIILFVMALATLIRKEYRIQCPYCNKDLSIDLRTEAMDCPICKERIIIDNYIPKKKE